MIINIILKMCQKRNTTKIGLKNALNYPAKVDDCMAKKVIKIQNKLNIQYPATMHLKVVACCCGHGIYPKTVVIRNDGHNTEKLHYEYYSGVLIPRIRNFYKIDGTGYFYIKEVMNNEKRTKRHKRRKRSIV